VFDFFFKLLGLIKKREYLTRIAYILLALFCCYVTLLSEPRDPNLASLSGYVVDSTTKETLIGVSVYVKSANKGAYTNKLGYFSISDIPPGMQEVIISFIGYYKKNINIHFKKGETLRKDIELNPSSILKDEVIIDADRDIEKREITISKVKIPAKNLKELRIGGEADVFRSLQYLPGILTSSQISSGLFVRGGSPDQNLVLVDGSTVYNPSHLFGFISTFNTNAVKDVELIKGGFPSEYGGRLSAVLNITQKNGNREKYEGMASLGALSSQINLEGPIGNGSFFIGGRRTYLELIKAVYDNWFMDEGDFPLPDFNFYDINAKISQDCGTNDKIFLSGFMSADNLAMEGFGTDMSLDVGNKLLSARWTHIFNDNLFSTINISGSHYVNNLDGDQSGYEFLIDNSVTDYSLKGSFEWFTSESLTMKFGFETKFYNFIYLHDFTGEATEIENDSSSVSINLNVKQWTESIYGQLNWGFTELLSMQAGMRVNYWELIDIITFDPRLAFRYQINEDISLKAAAGIFHQNLRLVTQPDFSFFDTWLPTDSSVPPSSAEHYILSLETYPFNGYKLNFDLYYKKMYNLSELNRTTLEITKVSDVFFIGNTRSYGAEMFLQKSYGRLTGWIGYALGYIYSQFDEINNGKEFRPKYDRRHDLKIVAQYQLNENFDIGAVFIFQSGQSYTGASSLYRDRLPGQVYGRAKLIPSQMYGLRLPPSHQLNLNGSWKFKMFGLDARLILDIYNLYNRRDIWFRYYNTQEDDTVLEDVKLLPILPTISLEVKF
jgi:hypothetical protein